MVEGLTDRRLEEHLLRSACNRVEALARLRSGDRPFR